MRLIDADALLEQLSKKDCEVHIGLVMQLIDSMPTIQREERDKLVYKTDTGAATLRPIDIEKLAEEHLTPFARTGWTAYGDQLTKFAEAYHRAKCEQSEAVGVVSWFEGTVIGSIFPSSNMPKDDDLLYTTPPDTVQKLEELQVYCGDLESDLKIQASEIAELKDKHIMQLAGISTASIGYFKDGDDIHPDYDTVALRDVTCLYSKYETLFNRDKELQAHINELREAFRKIRSCYGDGYEVDNIARQALSKTPAQSLQEFENEVIEWAVKAIEDDEMWHSTLVKQLQEKWKEKQNGI